MIRLLAYPVSRHLASDLLCVPRLRDWFLPAIVIERIRTRRLWNDAADGLWDFSQSIPLLRLFVLGAAGFLGTMVWLILPTFAMIGGTSRPTGGAALLSTLGVVSTTIVFCVLLVTQAEYASSGKIRDLFAIKKVFLRIRQAPIWHLLATLMTLILALPLFLLKIEEIPVELRPLLSIVFIATGWLSRIALGWANARASRANRPRRLWWALPVSSLMIPLAFVFVVVLFFTRYVSWHGAWSLIENPVFLLPAPFWL
jgi:hypothetical protein